MCHDVTEIQCEIVPYTECEMKMEWTPFETCEDYPVPYRKWTCEHGFGNQTHYKMMPECRNVTKQNCVTKWETDANGKQVSTAFLLVKLLFQLLSF